jgi:LemA protein
MHFIAGILYFIIDFVIFIVIAAVGLVLYTYNIFQKLAQEVKEADSNIKVNVKKKVDLVNKLISTAEQYGQHEKLTLIAISNNQTIASAAQTMANSDATLNKIQSMASSFPELKADKSFSILMDEIAKVEGIIQERREKYNEKVKFYNTKRVSIPHMFYASMIGFREAPYFTDEPGEMKEFKTDDGEMLKQALAQSVHTSIEFAKGATKAISGKASQITASIGVGQKDGEHGEEINRPIPEQSQLENAPGGVLPDNNSFKFCSDCGKKNSMESKFCHSCGKPLAK